MRQQHQSLSAPPATLVAVLSKRNHYTILTLIHLQNDIALGRSVSDGFVASIDLSLTLPECLNAAVRPIIQVLVPSKFANLNMAARETVIESTVLSPGHMNNTQTYNTQSRRNNPKP